MSESLKEVFDLEHAALKDVRSLGGEVIEVPIRSEFFAPKHIEELGQDLARFMRNFTGRGYDLSQATLAVGDMRYVREPGHEAYGLKLFAEHGRVLIGRVAVLEDEAILTNYVRHLKRYLVKETEKPKVRIDVPDDFGAAPVGK